MLLDGPLDIYSQISVNTQFFIGPLIRVLTGFYCNNKAEPVFRTEPPRYIDRQVKVLIRKLFTTETFIIAIIR